MTDDDARARGAARAAGPGELPAPRIGHARFELDSGVVLRVDRRPDAPVVALHAHMRGGHRLDPPGKEGTAHLAGRLADQGTELHTEEELAGLLEPQGGGLHGDAYGVAGTIAGGGWKLLVELVCEVLRRPVYPEDKFARQKERLLHRLLVQRDDPRVQAARLFRRLVYGESWLGRPSRGTLESVQAVTREDVHRFHRAQWCPRRLVVGFSGDVDPKRVKRAFEEHLAGWEPREPIAPPSEDLPELGPRADAFFAERQQVHVYLGHLGVRRSDPRYPALVLMDHVLGTGPGFTNRISRRLRDEAGLAYTVHADVHASAGVHPGTFTAYIGTSPDKVEAAVAGFLEEMRRIRDERVGADELELARSYLLGSFALGFERAARRASHLVRAERFGLPPDHLSELVRRLAAVSADEVREAARERLHPDRPCLAVGGPVRPARARELLRGLVGSPGSGGKGRARRRAKGSSGRPRRSRR